ncbi:MAG: YjbH domain-containing protein [Saprospiraceae bacterium]|nr:YjbH domain-containing protein [Saprospiraceae bacterium]
MSVRYGPIFWLIMMCTTVVRAQQVDQSAPTVSPADSIFCSKQEALLEQAGFPDASCVLADDQLLVSYTRSKYRLGATSTRKLLSNLGQLPPDRIRSVNVTIADRGIPFYTLFIPVENAVPRSGDASFEIGTHPFPSTRGRSPFIKGDDFTLLFSLDPQLRFAFGASPDPIQIQFNLLPRFDLRLWKGSLFRFQYIIPVWNELDIPEEDFFRPGLITLSQFFRLGRGFFANSTVGYFSTYRYGAQIQLCKFLLRDRAFFGTQFGYTGYASYPKRLYVDPPVSGWQVSDVEYLDYLLTAGWRWNKQHVQLIAGWGRGLFEQEIKSLMVSRQFNLTTVELFVQQLDQEWNYGLRLQIPLPFYRTFIGNRVQIQTSPFFDFQYNGTQNYLQEYRTGHRLPFLSDHLHPDLFEL